MEQDESFHDCLDYFIEERKEKVIEYIEEDENDREIPIRWNYENSYRYNTTQLEDIFT